LFAAGTFVATPTFAQEAPASAPPGEPVNPWTTTPPASAETAPAPAAPTTPSAASPSSETAPGVAPTVAPPGETPKAATSAAPPAAAHQDRPSEEPDDGKLHGFQQHLLFFGGGRVAKVSSKGFDPFADSDELAQFELGVGGTLLSSGNLSLAGLFLYDIGGRSDTARGAKSELTVHRLTLGAEGRYHFFRQLFVFGRVAPGVVHSIASIADQSADVDQREARDWVFATDLSAGASLALTNWRGSANKRKVNAWFSVDGGYGFAGESDLKLAPDASPGEEGGGPERGEPVDMGTLSLRGPFMRVVFVLSY
jgi:hypothetical protein